MKENKGRKYPNKTYTKLICMFPKCKMTPTTIKNFLPLSISEAVVQRRSVKKVFLEISQKFTEKHLCQSLFLKKVAGLRTPFLTEHLW